MQTRWEGFWAFPSAELPSLEQSLLPSESKLCPTSSCGSADPDCAQHRTAARAEIAMCPVLLSKAPSSTSSKNQSIPDLIYIVTVPRPREDLVHHTNCSPQRDKSVLLEELLRSESLKNVSAAWDFCCAQGLTSFGHFTLFSSFSVPLATQENNYNRKYNHPNQPPANLYWQSTKPR